MDVLAVKVPENVARSLSANVEKDVKSIRLGRFGLESVRLSTWWEVGFQTKLSNASPWTQWQRKWDA